MIVVKTEKCTGCGICADECHIQSIVVEEGKAKPLDENCIECGHCFAICPENAIEITDYDMDDVIEVSPIDVTAGELLSLIKIRRSIRKFKDIPVEKDLIKKIIEAGRYTATAGNLQGLSFIVVDNKMHEFRKLVIENLVDLGQEIIESGSSDARLIKYANWWLTIGESYEKNPQEKDTVFYEAPLIILIAGNNAIDAGLAASNMELVAFTSGLGALYSGHITRGVAKDEIKDFIGVPKSKDVLTVMLFGYPDVEYLRSAPRKMADIIWA